MHLHQTNMSMEGISLRGVAKQDNESSSQIWAGISPTPCKPSLGKGNCLIPKELKTCECYVTQPVDGLVEEDSVKFKGKKKQASSDNQPQNKTNLHASNRLDFAKSRSFQLPGW
ncbi:hypothetical protein TNCV_2514781 [Trichonephila clavipes]|nr:hypothetical protein TNCV_2514781 [Trichonephila clavipes]